MDDIAKRLAQAPGFGACLRCPWVETGSIELCSTCARGTLEGLVDSDARCEICDLPYNAGESQCMNPVCNMGQRWFKWNYAIAMRSGPLENAISAYKYGGKRGWAAIFGRILVGFLETNRATFGNMDLIIASPTYAGEDAHRDWDHVGAILDAAEWEQLFVASWPFHRSSPPVVVKNAETGRMVGMGYQERKANAQGPLRAALQVPDPSKTAGKHVVVVDDVFTDGLTLNEVARALHTQGHATAVYGVSLARQPWGRK